MAYLSVTYDSNNFYIDWGDYFPTNTSFTKSQFTRSYVGQTHRDEDADGNVSIEITLKDKTTFRLALTQLNPFTHIISNFNGSPVVDIDTFYNSFKLLPLP